LVSGAAIEPLVSVGACSIGERVLRIGFVDDRRAGLQCFLHVEHRGQRLIVDAQLCDGLGGLALAVGDNGHHRLALVAHLVDRERRLVVLAEIDQAEQGIEVTRHVGAADDAADSGVTLGLDGVDAAYAGVRMRAAQDLQMQHALQFVVVEIGRGAGDMTEHVLALGALADLLEIVVTLVGEYVLAQFQHSSSSGTRASA
jgi:hypothetical protein